MNKLQTINYKLPPRKAHAFRGGYTFIELIVVIAIFSIISSAVIFNSGTFSSNISLQNTTSDIALQIKEAQSDAIAGRLNEAINTIGAENFKPAYGISFSIDTPSMFTKFTDLDKDRVYGGDCSVLNSECLAELNINGFDTIAQLCVREIGSSALDCSVETLDVSFERPFPDAIITADSNSGIFYNDAEIVLVSSKQVQRKVIISATGNISVSQMDP